MNSIKKYIPNALTLLNLFCGCVAIICISNLRFDLAFYFVCLGIFFDFFDGFFARKFNVSGPLGVQLDSLADMVTSGVAPGFVMFCLFSQSNFSLTNYLPYLGFIITLGACFRLAKFNIDTRQSNSFIGLPTPANALFIMSLPLIISFHPSSIITDLLQNNYVLIFISVLSVYMMNAEIPLFSLKIKKFDFKSNQIQLIFLAVSVLLLVFLKVVAIPIIILFYVFLSVLNNFVFLKKIK